MIIGITGRMCSGKGVVKDYFSNKGFRYTTFSDVVRAEAIKRGIELKREYLQDLGNELREQEGGEVWAKKIIQKMENGKNYVVDGIRNPGEIDELKKAQNIGKFFLISVDASRERRFDLMVKRAKESDPKNWEDFVRLDNRDFGIGEPDWGQQSQRCMEMADFKIENNGDVEEFMKRINQVYEKIQISETVD